MCDAAAHLEGATFAAGALADLALIESDDMPGVFCGTGAVDAIAETAYCSMVSRSGDVHRMDDQLGANSALALKNFTTMQGGAIAGAVTTPLGIKVLHLLLDGNAGDGAAVTAGIALNALHESRALRGRLELLQSVLEGDEERNLATWLVVVCVWYLGQARAASCEQPWAWVAERSGLLPVAWAPTVLLLLLLLLASVLALACFKTVSLALAALNLIAGM
jgi:hypothetical protein